MEIVNATKGLLGQNMQKRIEKALDNKDYLREMINYGCLAQIDMVTASHKYRHMEN
jgi:hypothetical protein